MKITRHKAQPVVTPPDTFTLELTLDEMIFLKTVCNYYADDLAGRARHTTIAAAKRFASNIEEDNWSWTDTDKLFK